MKKQRNDFVLKENNYTSESWYDLIEDYDLIEASFAQQYGIRLRQEADMSWGEFCTLLAGINEKTPLGRVVMIRSEKDPKAIKNFTKEQKKIRNNWRNKSVIQFDKQNYDEAMMNFENMFKAMSK